MFLPLDAVVEDSITLEVYEEISRKLGVTEVNACTLLFRFRQRFRRLLTTIMKLIKTSDDHAAALGRLEKLMVADPAPNSSEEEELELLAFLVDDYEM